jgi:hypothetical protein
MLSFSSYLGGNSSENDNEFFNSIAVSNDGSIYVTGQTYSTDFPTKNAYDNSINGNSDGFITKFSASGTILWSTYFGSNDYDRINDIAVSSDDSIYVTGTTSSSDFPTLNAYNETYGGDSDAFVAKFSADGDLVWATFLGGSLLDYGYGIAVGSDGSFFVTGITQSFNFPTKNAFDSTLSVTVSTDTDAFITKFSSNGALLWSSYLGGNLDDRAFGIEVDADGNCFVSGYTNSIDFPTLNAFESTISASYCCHFDAFVTKFSSTGTLLWSTYLGGSQGSSDSFDLVVGSAGDVFVVGITAAGNFPIKDAFDPTINGGTDAYLTKFSSNGTLLLSTFFGGTSDDVGLGIAISSNDSCIISGITYSINFPILNGFDDTQNGDDDAFIVEFSSNGSLIYSSYLGGKKYDIGNDVAVDNEGNRYITGYTLSNDFPTENSYDNSLDGPNDVFICKIVLTEPTTVQTGIKTSYILLIISIIFPIIVTLHKRKKIN